MKKLGISKTSSWVAKGLLILFIAFLTVLFAINYLLYTEIGNDIVESQINKRLNFIELRGLEIHRVEGEEHSISFDSLKVEVPMVDVEIHRAKGLFKWSRFFRGEVALEKVTAQQVNIGEIREAQSTPKANKGPPITFRLDLQNLQKAVIKTGPESNLELKQLKGLFTLFDGNLTAKQAQLFFEEYQIQIVGSLNLKQSLNANLESRIANRSLPLNLQLHLAGPLSQPDIKFNLLEPFQLSGSGWGHPFQKGIPVELQINTDELELNKQSQISLNSTSRFVGDLLPFSGKFNSTGEISYITKSNEKHQVPLKGQGDIDFDRVYFENLLVKRDNDELTGSGAFHFRETENQLIFSGQFSGKSIARYTDNQLQSINSYFSVVGQDIYHFDQTQLVVRLKESELENSLFNFNLKGTTLIKPKPFSLQTDDLVLWQENNAIRIQGILSDDSHITLSTGSFDLGKTGLLKQGIVKGKLELAGQLNQPDINYSLQINNLTQGNFHISKGSINGRGNWAQSTHSANVEAFSTDQFKLNDIHLDMAGALETFQLKAKAKTPLVKETLEVSCSGGFKPSKDWAISCPNSQASLSVVNRWLPPTLTASGTMAVDFEANGKEQQLISTDFRIRGQSPQLSWLIPSGDTINLKPSVFYIKGSTIDQKLLLESELSLNHHSHFLSRVEYQNETLNGQVDIESFSIELLTPFLPDSTHISGVANAQFKVGGSITNPTIEGSYNVKEGVLQDYHLGFETDHITVSGKVKDNVFDYQGNFEIRKEKGKLKGQTIWKSDGWLATMDVGIDSFFYQPDEQTKFWLSPQLKLQLEPNSVSITGNVSIPKTRIILDKLPETPVPISKDAVIVSEQDDSTTTGMNQLVDLTITLEDDVYFRGFGAEGYLQGQINYRQKDNAPYFVNGSIQLNKARYEAYGQKLAITNGQLLFNGSLLNPRLMISAVRDDLPEDVEVGIRVTGNAKQPITSLFSTPPMSDYERLYYLITGDAPDATGDQDMSSMVKQALLTLSIAKSESGLASYAEKAGIDDLRLKAGAGKSGQEVQIGGKVRDRLYLQYGHDLSEKADTVMMRYKLSEKFYLEALSGISSSLDLLYIYQKK